MEFHEISMAFGPMLPDAELTALADSIKANGLRHAITTYECKILDGRNRYAACILANIEPRFEEYTGSDPRAFAIDENVKRRHWNESQRAMCAARLANMPLGGAVYRSANLPTDGISQPKAAEMLNVGERSIRSAKTVIEAGVPELISIVDAGKVAVSLAAQVATMPQDTQEEIVRRVKLGNTFSQAIKNLRDESKRAMPFPANKYQVIYADPPWQYENSGFDESAENQYPTMPTDEICDLPIKQLCTEESVLFLWATNPLLEDAVKVLHAWGFEYKTNMAWIKDKARGKGWFLKSKHELLLIGTREHTPPPSERMDSCFEAERGTVHSRKPECVYGMIEEMYPGCKVELFARQERNGWESWGNEL